MKDRDAVPVGCGGIKPPCAEGGVIASGNEDGLRAGRGGTNAPGDMKRGGAKECARQEEAEDAAQCQGGDICGDEFYRHTNGITRTLASCSVHSRWAPPL